MPHSWCPTYRSRRLPARSVSSILYRSSNTFRISRVSNSLLGGALDDHAGLARGEGKKENITNEPDNVEDPEDPEGCHQLVSRGSPGDSPDQPASIRAFDGTTPLWLITLLHTCKWICKSLVRRRGGHWFTMGCTATRHSRHVDMHVQFWKGEEGPCRSMSEKDDASLEMMHLFRSRASLVAKNLEIHKGSKKGRNRGERGKLGPT